MKYLVSLFFLGLVSGIFSVAIPDEEPKHHEGHHHAEKHAESDVTVTGCEQRIGKEAIHKALVLEAIQAIFGDHDVAALDKYFHPHYLNHHPDQEDGIESLKKFVEQFGKGREKKEIHPVRISADDDLVWTHMKLENLNGHDVAAIAIVRFEHGKIVEYWDVIQPILPVPDSKNPHPFF